MELTDDPISPEDLARTSYYADGRVLCPAGCTAKGTPHAHDEETGLAYPLLTPHTLEYRMSTGGCNDCD